MSICLFVFMFVLILIVGIESVLFIFLVSWCGIVLSMSVIVLVVFIVNVLFISFCVFWVDLVCIL